MPKILVVQKTYNYLCKVEILDILDAFNIILLGVWEMPVNFRNDFM